MQIDHVGIVVKNIDETMKIFSNVFGFKGTDVIINPEGEFKTALVSSSYANLELIEPLGSNGSIAKFLEHRGGGIHHFSLRVENINEELRSLEAKGIRLVNAKPFAVSSSLVAFIHPGSTGGILVELIQRV